MRLKLNKTKIKNKNIYIVNLITQIKIFKMFKSYLKKMRVEFMVIFNFLKKKKVLLIKLEDTFQGND